MYLYLRAVGPLFAAPTFPLLSLLIGISVSQRPSLPLSYQGAGGGGGGGGRARVVKFRVFASGPAPSLLGSFKRGAASTPIARLSHGIIIRGIVHH